MLTFEQIKELIDLVAAHRLSEVELERSGFRLRVEGHKPAASAAPAAAAEAPAAVPVTAGVSAAVPAEAPAEGPAPGEEKPAAVPPDAHTVTSPIVGTFYRGPNPAAASFVDVGTRVKKGQTLCIIEAMKLMNEIESDVDGVVVAIYPKNAQPVEFGEDLFAVKTD